MTFRLVQPIGWILVLTPRLENCSDNCSGFNSISNAAMLLINVVESDAALVVLLISDDNLKSLLEKLWINCHLSASGPRTRSTVQATECHSSSSGIEPLLLSTILIAPEAQLTPKFTIFSIHSTLLVHHYLVPIFELKNLL